MNQRILKIRWHDGRNVNIVLEDNPVADFYYRCIKHLQHLDLYFSPREDPYHPMLCDRDQAVDKLVEYFAEWGIAVDREKTADQTYLNHLHDIYFKSCTASHEKNYYARWMKVHDYIHIVECINKGTKEIPAVVFNYRDKAGPMYCKFDRSLLKYSQNQFDTGTCFLHEQELGKNPLVYFRDNEPRDLDVMCQQVKPWVNLIPTMNLALEDIMPTVIPPEFVKWFEPVKEQWAKSWGANNWQPEEIGTGIAIGKVEDIDTIVKCFHMQDYPIRITL